MGHHWTMLPNSQCRGDCAGAVALSCSKGSSCIKLLQPGTTTPAFSCVCICSNSKRRNQTVPADFHFLPCRLTLLGLWLCDSDDFSPGPTSTGYSSCFLGLSSGPRQFRVDMEPLWFPLKPSHCLSLLGLYGSAFQVMNNG